MRIATIALALALSAAVTAAGPLKFQRVAIGAEGVNHNARSAAFEEGGRFMAVNASLHVLIVTAYRGVWPPQDTPALQVLDGPDWLGTEGFTIAALAPAGSSRPEMHAEGAARRSVRSEGAPRSASVADVPASTPSPINSG
jgi:hypothetical protein